jgi:hypothetical protein
MSIKEMLEKIKPFYNLVVIIIIAFIFFVLGRISAIEERHQPIKIQYNGSEQAASSFLSTQATTTESSVGRAEVIGSKSGKKYYFPWCGTVKRIKPENQVVFF